MEILVCIKQVPDTAEVKINPETNTVIRAGVPNIVNPFDKNGLEEALKLKEKHGGRVVVLSMGPEQAKEALRECLAIGADEAYLVSDRVFGGADTLATSYTLAKAIEKLGKFDIIFCGKQAIDGDTAQVGPQIAEALDIPQITYAAAVDVEGTTIRVKREHEEGYEIIETTLPVLLTAVKDLNEPRFPSIKGKMKAKKKEIPVWTAADLDVDPERIGLKGSPTKVKGIHTPSQRSQGLLIQEEDAEAAVAVLVSKLQENKLI